MGEEQVSENDVGAGPPEFAELYARHFRSLTLQLNAYFGDLEQAQDVVQEAFVRALDKWKKIQNYEDPAAWVRRVAWNLATSQWRRRRMVRAYALRQRQETVAGPGPERVALIRALATIPNDHRRAVILHYIADLSVAQIAEQEGVAEGTVKSWLSRGRAALNSRLAIKEV
nr:SigE family RNA polymerase sigma factor [Rhizocola hellebori]